jgi:hypothetical protein
MAVFVKAKFPWPHHKNRFKYRDFLKKTPLMVAFKKSNVTYEQKSLNDN